MSFRLGVFCFILSLLVLLLAYQNYEIWSQPIGVVVAKGAMKKTEIKTENPILPTMTKEVPPRESFFTIAEKNIFNPDRKEFPLLLTEQAKPVVRPQVILYGVVVGDGFTTASVVNPGRPLKKGERETLTVKIGDPVGDYKIAKILPDRIVMEAAGDSFEVLLFDPRSPKRRVEVKTAATPATITSTLPGSPQAPTPVPGEISRPIPVPIQPTPLPRAVQPAPERVIEPTLPRPEGAAGIPDPGIWRGRTPVRQGTQDTALR
jgi:hypothetical protein